MRRRGVGIGALKKKKEAAQKFKQAGQKLQAEKIEHVTEQLSSFKTHLEEFARKYKNEIKKNPEFRQQFQTMCGKIGVDPLQSNKGVWAELLGVGDFYYELAVQIVDICYVTRARNGGLIGMDELKVLLERKRGPAAQKISLDDIRRSSKKLQKLGKGFRLLEVGKRNMVVSVPLELSEDHTVVLKLAEDKSLSTLGVVSASLLIQKQGWDKERAARALALLVREGMAWIDDQAPGGERHYWFPSIWHPQLAHQQPQQPPQPPS